MTWDNALAVTPGSSTTAGQRTSLRLLLQTSATVHDAAPEVNAMSTIKHHAIGAQQHRHVAARALRGARANPTMRCRLRGYLEAHRCAGVSVRAELMREGNSTVTGGRRDALEPIRQTQLTALLSANNAMTIGALLALHELGIQVGTELAFVSFDDLEWAEAMPAPAHRRCATLPRHRRPRGAATDPPNGRSLTTRSSGYRRSSRTGPAAAAYLTGAGRHQALTRLSVNTIFRSNVPFMVVDQILPDPRPRTTTGVATGRGTDRGIPKRRWPPLT